MREDATPRRRPDRGYFGRRKGRSLSGARAALLQDLLPRLRAPLDPSGPSDPRRWFTPPAEDVWLEIGFGGGEHLAWQATNNPAVGLVGAEVFVNGVASLLGQVQAGSLANIRIHPEDVHALLDGLEPACLGRVFLLFPDPWPKRRHAARRFLSPENLDRLAVLMRRGAELRFASDDPVMIAWGLRHLTGHPGFRWLAAGPDDWRKRPADWPATRYERKAIGQGRKPVFFRFERC
jgi:tRNA (guanine-N7-)-methyltransferase